MTIKFTAEMVEAAYDFLLTTPPFNKWNLPAGEDIKFVIVKTPRIYGEHWKITQGYHYISISLGSVGYTTTLLETLAHEIVHLYLKRQKMQGKRHHGVEFRALAALVCRYHRAFDPKRF